MRDARTWVDPRTHVVVNGDVHVHVGGPVRRAPTLGARLAVASCQGAGSVLAVAGVLVGAVLRLAGTLLLAGGRDAARSFCRVTGWPWPDEPGKAGGIASGIGIGVLMIVLILVLPAVLS